MRRKRKVARIILADICLVIGMVATVVGSGLAYSWSLAIFLGGLELIAVAFALAVGRPRGGDGS